MSYAGLLLGIAVFLLPGILALKFSRRGTPPGTSFLVSCIVLFHILFFLQLAGIAMTFFSVSACLISVSAAILAVLFFRSSKGMGEKGDSAELSDGGSSSGGRSHICALLIASPALLLLAVRYLSFPMPGWDVNFRWNFLAERIFEYGNFSFYPPVSASDFRFYSFPDGIPPLVSFLDFWIYESSGKCDKLLTLPLVAGQFMMVCSFAFLGASRLFSSGYAGKLCVAALAYAPLFFWSVLIGQETGMTSLSFAAMTYFIVSDRSENRDFSMPVFAAFSAAVGALSREYGPAFIVCGILMYLLRRCGRQKIVVFALLSSVLASPWYMRNWVVTGNPFYSIDVFGLFPVNPVFSGILATYDSVFWDIHRAKIVPLFLEYSLLLFPLQILLGAAAIIFFFRKMAQIWIPVFFILAIWVCSLGMTAGGFFCSMRVLSPAIVLLSMLVGGLAAACPWKGVGRYLPVLAVILVSIAGFLQELTIPLKVWKLDADGIRNAVFEKPSGEGPIEAAIRMKFSGSGGRTRILTDSMYLHSALNSIGGDIDIVTVWSPEVRFLFEKEPSFEEQARRLLEIGIGHFIFTPQMGNYGYLSEFTFFMECPSRCEMEFSEQNGTLYRICR